MSLYFTFLFGFLTSEMVALFLIVLPLPTRIRKLIFKSWNMIINSKEYRTVGIIFAVIVGLLFIDSWKRANIPVHVPGHPSAGETSDTLKSNDPVTSIQVFATRAYNQRNVYISGFILYFLVAIPCIMTLYERLIKYQDLIDMKIKKGAEAKNMKTGDKELDELRDTFKQREASLLGLKKQIENFESHWDESVKVEVKVEDASVKKSN